MKNILLITGLLLSTMFVNAQEHFGTVEIYSGFNKKINQEVMLKLGGFDEDVLNIGGFRYGIQFEHSLAVETEEYNRNKFSVYGGMYWNTFIEKLKLITDINGGIVWKGAAAGIRYGANLNLAYALGPVSLSGGIKYDDYKNKVKPIVGVNFRF